MINLQHLSVKQLLKVVAVKERIEKLEAKLAAIYGSEGSDFAPAGRPRRKMSAAAKARIAAAQRARWAKVKGRKGSATNRFKKKRKVSAATKARLAAVAKARWAKVKAAGKSAL